MSAVLAASEGCTVCKTQDTATADGVNGRRCETHPPTFDPGHAVHLAIAGWRLSAFAYARTEFPR